LFFKKRVQREDDRIWMTTDLKWKGIVDDVLRERGEAVFILVVAHFKKTAAELKKQFQSRGPCFPIPILYVCAGLSRRLDY
jgi:hypothetical protein